MDKNKIITFLLIIYCAFIPKVYSSVIYPDDFINNFSICQRHTNATDKKIMEIVGWGNRRCYYREITSKDMIECAFREHQVHEISNAMKNDHRTLTPLVVQYSDGTTAQYNTGWSAFNVWKKYLNMPGVCMQKR